MYTGEINKSEKWGEMCNIYPLYIPLQQGSQAEEVKGFEDRWRTEQSRSGFNQSNHLTTKNPPQY